MTAHKFPGAAVTPEDARALLVGINECKAWYAGRDAVRQHVQAKERRATDAENEAAGLRTTVEAFRRAACVALGWGEDTTPGDWTLLRDLRATDIKGLTARAEAAEAALDIRTKDRDSLNAAWQAAEEDVRRLTREAKEAEDAALAERNAAAEAIRAALVRVDPTSALRWEVVREIASALEAEATDEETVQAGAVWMAVKVLRAVVVGVSDGK